MIVLALNAGSSSVKFALFDSGEGAELELARGAVECVGQTNARLVVTGGFGPKSVGSRIPCKDVLEAASIIFAALEDTPLPHPQVVGHRLVHGGPHYDMPHPIDAALRRELEGIVRFSPLHLPRSLALIDAVSERFGDIPQVACFDTTFHRSLPDVARRFALPQELHDAGIHRYGFHGLSYEYIVRTLGAKRLGRAVLAHLGSGSSFVAVRNGKSIDTTMGLTPSGGVMMGTRCGDVDPGLIVHLMDHLGYDARKLEELVNTRSGLLGVSGTTSDMKTLLDARGRDPRAKLAVDMFCYSARKFVGAYAATLGGIDTLVFTGGIGERAAPVRSRICEGLEHLGIQLDEVLNGRHCESIGGRDARCRVLVVRTDEERMIAHHAVHAARSANRFARPHPTPNPRPRTAISASFRGAHLPARSAQPRRLPREGRINRATSPANRRKSMRREVSEYKHAIRTRITLGHADTHAVTHSVYCAMHDQSVPLATCIACPKLVAFPARPAAIGATVTCHAPAGEALRTSDVERAATRTHISEIMNRNIVCVFANAGWESLERLLLDDEFEAIPVVDILGRPIGIVSKTDLLRRTRCDEGEVDTRPASFPEPGLHIDRRAGITAEDVMTPVVHALPEDAPLSFVIAALALEGVTQIPIVSKRSLVVGMVSTQDAVTWLAHQLGCIARPPKPLSRACGSTSKS